jgi:hypothetical protein
VVTQDSRVVRNGKEEQRSYIGALFIRVCSDRANDRLITLNALKASDEITEEQSRQVCTPPENDDVLMVDVI